MSEKKGGDFARYIWQFCCLPTFIANPCLKMNSLTKLDRVLSQVLLEKLKGSTPKLCDSLVMNDVDTSAQLTSATDSGFGSDLPSAGEGKESNQVTFQGLFSLAFQQVGESRPTAIS